MPLFLTTLSVLLVVDFLIDRVGGEQLIVRADSLHGAAVENDDLIRILHGGNTLCNDNLGRVRDFLRECLADERIRFGIDRTGRVIKNEDLRLFQQRTRNSESLLLNAGDI